MPSPSVAETPAKYRRQVLAAVALFSLVTWSDTARSQTAPAPAAEPPAASLAPSPSPPPAQQPPSALPSLGGGGLIEKLGDWLKGSAEGVSSGLKGTQQRIDDINKGTLDTLSRIPVTGFASGRALCPRAANGAPDCYAASDTMCRERGYTSGRSLDTESAETCNPRIYMPGYKRKEGDCRVDTFVTRAACQ